MSESKKRPIVLSTTPGWMVTYADMMALLLCLFVLLLSFSDIDSTSFQQNAGPIREAFNPSVIIPSNKPTLPSRVFIPPVVEPQERKIRPEDTRIAEMLREDMRIEIENKAMELDMTDDRIIIRFPGRAAFPSGSATPAGGLPAGDRQDPRAGRANQGPDHRVGSYRRHPDHHRRVPIQLGPVDGARRFGRA